MIMDGELDHIPEAAFNLKGTIEEAIEAGEKMIAESNNNMQLEIVSPEKTIFSGEAKSVHLPGSEGHFQVLNNHAPIVSTLKKGEILIDGVDNNPESDFLDFSNGKASLEIKSGVVEMKKNKLIILVD